MAHSHADSSRIDRPTATSAQSLRTAFLITVSVLVLEAVGGLLTGSVALLADAGHMLTDAGALGIALFAARLSERPRTAQKSFGYGRVEILAALANGLLLGGVSVGIALESFERLAEPQSISAAPMIAIALVGLGANLVSARILAHSARDNLNVKAALFHVLGDALGSVAAIIAGVMILLWQLTIADAIAGLVIALLIIAGAFRVVRDSVDILLESAPRHLDLNRIGHEMCETPGVSAVHDLHIWTVSTGFLAMSAHVDLAPGAQAETVRRAIHRLLHQQYGIVHTTIQTEEAPALLSIERNPT